MAVLAKQFHIPLYNGKRYTYQETLQLEDDGFQYEIVQGVMTMTPAPFYDHQLVVTEICTELNLFLRAHPIGKACIAPRDVKFSETLVYQPDLLFIANERLAINLPQYVDGAPDFVVEVLSPATRLRDTQDKRADYERYGVREYWILDPAHIPSSQFYSLDPDTYLAFLPQDGYVASRAIPGFGIDLNVLAEKLQ